MVPVGDNQVTVEEKRCALNSVLSSAALARSDRLKNLLRYLCESEIEGRASDLNERAIGVHALGLRPEYSPTENSAVRSRVHELRRRLEKYYSSEAPSAPIRILLSKGSYVPTFVHNGAVPTDAELNGYFAPTFRFTPALRPRQRFWLSTAAALLAGALGMFLVLSFGPLARGRFGRSAAQAKGGLWTPELEAIWSPFLDSQVPLLVSFESRLFLRIGSVNVRDWAIDEMNRVESSKNLMAIKELFHQPQLYENRNYADFGAVHAAFELAQLLGSRHPRLLLKGSSGVTPQDTRDSDVIYLSKPSTDPGLRHLLERGPFIDERLRIRNVNPKPGELQEYVARPDPKDPDRSGERYLLITQMPGFYRNRRILSLACFNSEDPWALADFVTSPEHAREMYNKMRLPNGKMPDFYQVVVKVQFRAQSPVQTEYVTHRVLSAGDRSQ